MSTYQDFLDEIHVTDQQYILAIRASLKSSKVFLKRAPNEIYTNAYNPVLLSSWQANMDIQFCLDPWAVILYIVKYMSKGERGMSRLMDQACRLAKDGDQSLKEQVRAAGNTWTNKSEIPVQEAVAYILQLPFRNMSRQVIFINSSPPEQRTGLLKDESALAKLESDSTEICADNKIRRYERRPHELSDWGLADFATKLNLARPYMRQRKGTGDWLKESMYDKDDDDDHDDECTGIQAASNSSTEIDLKMKLEDGKILKFCRNQKVLRSVRYKKEKDAENYYRELLFLYYPWRKESAILQDCDTYQERYEEVKCPIDKKVLEYEQLSNTINPAIELAEMLDSDGDFDIESSGDEHEDLATDVCEDQYVCFDPGTNPLHNSYDIGQDLGLPRSTPSSAKITKVSLPNAMCTTEYKALLRSFNTEQRKFFDHVLFWFSTSHEPMYQFCTSGAGCGKTYLLKAIYQGLIRLFSSQHGQNPEAPNVLLLSFTGKASFNIGGMTIHSAFQIPVSQSLKHYKPLQPNDLNSLATKLENIKVVIID